MGEAWGGVHLAGQVPEDTAHHVAQLAMEADDLRDGRTSAGCASLPGALLHLIQLELCCLPRGRG